MGQPNVLIGDWRFYTDATPDTSMSPLAAENTPPTLTKAQIQNGTIRLRCQLLNTGDKDALDPVEVQYSVDDTNWNTISNQAGASADQWIWWKDGAATHGNTVTNLLLADSDTYGLYHEDTGLNEDVDQGTKVEFDCALYIQWPPPSTTLRLRILVAGAVRPMEGGVPQIQVTTPSPSNRDYTIDKLDWPTYDSSTVELRGAMRPNTFWDGSNWWTFVADADDGTKLGYYYWPGTGTWSAMQTTTFTYDALKRKYDVRYKAISTYHVVFVFWNQRISGYTNYKRGTISGTSINWGEEGSTGVDDYGERVAVAIDDGNYWWLAGIDSGTGVYAMRATNADAGSSWTAGFETRRTAADAGVTTSDQIALIGLASNKALMIWRSGAALKWSLLSEPGGFGTVNTLVTTAQETDWGLARSGGYIYLVHTDSTGTGGNWVLRVFTESSDSWSLGTSPSVSGQPSDGDGLLVQAEGNNIWAWGSFTGTGGSPHRSIEGKKYTGPGDSGTWDGTRTVITPALSRGNSDHINGAPATANGKALVLLEHGDANLDGQRWSFEFHYETVAAPIQIPLDALTGAGSLPLATLTPGAISIPIDPLTGAASLPLATLTPGAISIPIDPLTGAGSLPLLTITPGATSIPLDALAGAGSLPLATLAPGAISIPMDPLTGGGSLPQLTVSAIVSIPLDPLTGAASLPLATITPGATSIPLDALTGAASLPLLTVTTAIVIPLDALTGAATTPTLILQLGETIITLDALTGAPTLPKLTVISGIYAYSYWL